MPELPEVEGVVRALAPVAIGTNNHGSDRFGYCHRVKSNLGKKQLSKGLRLMILSWILIGMTIIDVTRRSKYIYFDLKKEGNDISSCQPSWYVGGLVHCSIQLMKLRN